MVLVGLVVVVVVLVGPRGPRHRRCNVGPRTTALSPSSPQVPTDPVVVVVVTGGPRDLVIVVVTLVLGPRRYRPYYRRSQRTPSLTSLLPEVPGTSSSSLLRWSSDHGVIALLTGGPRTSSLTSLLPEVLADFVLVDVVVVVVLVNVVVVVGLAGCLATVPRWPCRYRCCRWSSRTSSLSPSLPYPRGPRRDRRCFRCSSRIIVAIVLVSVGPRGPRHRRCGPRRYHPRYRWSPRTSSLLSLLP